MRGKDAKQFQLCSYMMYNVIMLIIQAGTSGQNSRVYYIKKIFSGVFPH